MPAEVREQALAKIDELFRSSPDGLAVPAVRELVKEVYYTLCCVTTTNALFAFTWLSVCLRVKSTARAGCNGQSKQLHKRLMACCACFAIHSYNRSTLRTDSCVSTMECCTHGQGVFSIFDVAVENPLLQQVHQNGFSLCDGMRCTL